MTDEAKFIVTAVDRDGTREVRKSAVELRDAKIYAATVPRDKMPEIWVKIGERAICESSTK